MEVCVRTTAMLLSIGLGLTAIGCTPPPPRIPVPDSANGNPYQTKERDPSKPLPPSATQQSRAIAPPAQVQQPPMPMAVPQEYIDAYDSVGRPRLLVLIERPQSPPTSLVPGDYDLIERVFRDTVGAGGQVATVSADAIREKLSAQQIADVLSNNGSAVSDAAAALHADVLIDLRVAPAGDQTQITATARNTRDGQQIATAVATTPAASARRQIDFTGRLLGERMISTLANVWEQMSKQPAPGSPTTAPATTRAA